MVDEVVERRGLIPSELYRRILAVMPIVCVDLVVVDTAGRLLLLRRRDEPAKGRWWFPGGRVHLGETRVESAARKLKEECGLTPDDCKMTDVVTADVMLSDDQGGLRHAVSTVFRIGMSKRAPALRLDAHSETADWRAPSGWLREDLHHFVRNLVTRELDMSARATSYPP
jgi:ADP-ribose pyrophosphatase YjhB (NUDIX family)